jgi:dTDP-4-amino-4,6-dideoxy-D-galactose acyltransferase
MPVGTKNMIAVCTFEILPWDSEFFGFGVGRLHAESLTPELAADARQWCRDNGVSCIYFLGAPEAVDNPGGFYFVDTRVTCRWDARPVEGTSPAVRPFESGDLAALEAIARCSHRDTRFYQDPEFDRARCDELYATWIRRSCQGGADTVLVATDRGQPAGYLTCSGNSIGLFAVAEGARGRGLGAQLLTAAQRYFHASGAACVEVVTQGRNRTASELYLRLGFRVVKTQHWYHLHV